MKDKAIEKILRYKKVGNDSCVIAWANPEGEIYLGNIDYVGIVSSESDAALIVRTVNTHERLVEALRNEAYNPYQHEDGCPYGAMGVKGPVDYTDCACSYKKIIALIAEAEGQR